jgi:alpha-glucosidase (family GH31 glycosyl hydrolase)
MPIIRALWFRYPDDPVAVARGDEYLWGRDILVAPVVKKGATSRALYLPRGSWYDFWTQEKVEGGKEITRAVDLATMPLYVSAGAIIPVGPIKQYTSEKVDAPLTLWVYPGADANFQLYEDDGTTFNFRKGEFMKVDVAWKNTQRQLSLRMAAGAKMLAPAQRNIVIRIAGEKTVREAVFDGRPLDIKL